MNRYVFAAVIALVAAISGSICFVLGTQNGSEAMYRAGYEQGYADNVFYGHDCGTPEKVGVTLDCSRYPVASGKNTDGIPPVKLVVDQDLFDSWNHAKTENDKHWAESGEDEKFPTTIACQINGRGEVKDCMFPTG